MSTETIAPMQETTPPPAPVKRRRRRRTNSQLMEIQARLLKIQEKESYTPIKPVSRHHPVGMRPIHEFLTTGQLASALRISRNRVHDLMNKGRLSPNPVRMGLDTFLFHRSTSYQRKVPGWVASGAVVSAEAEAEKE